MSGELVPPRSELRASHEDRDEVVERLRVAAGDGRLNAEELDERLEKALNARTYGELDVLLTDLPEVPGAAAPPAAKDFVALESRSGNIRRNGPWTVPRAMDLRVHSGNVHLDLTQAVITHPTLELEVEVKSGNVTLIVPRGVVADMDSVAVRSGNLRNRARHDPGTPVRLAVTISGSIRSGNVTIRRPRRTFWQWLTRKPRPE